MNMTTSVRERSSSGALTTALDDGGRSRYGTAGGTTESLDEVGPGSDGHALTAPGSPVVTALRVSLLMVAAVAIGVVANLTLVSRLEQRATQFKETGQLRYKFAAETAPAGPVQGHHKPLALGTPMALLRIPSIGVKEIVDEGTTGQILMAGPGHLPSTVFPGGLGTSVIYGRASTYGGPFARIAQLHKGAKILVTTQDGPPGGAVFEVTDIRTAGQKIPAIGRGGCPGSYARRRPRSRCSYRRGPSTWTPILWGLPFPPFVPWSRGKTFRPPSCLWALMWEACGC